MAETARPADVETLESVFGPPGRDTIGTAVFHRARPDARGGLEQDALAIYRAYNGDSWERFGEAAWLSGWAPVYVRPPGTPRDIVAELRSIADPEIRSIVSMFLEGHESPDRAARALGDSFDRDDVRELRVFRTGDGGAISGLLIASLRTSGEGVFLVFQYD